MADYYERRLKIQDFIIVFALIFAVILAIAAVARGEEWTLTETTKTPLYLDISEDPPSYVCTDDIVQVLEDALKYIPDPAERKSLSIGIDTTLPYRPYDHQSPSQIDTAESAVAQAQSNLDKLRKMAELHNRIKAIITKLRRIR